MVSATRFPSETEHLLSSPSVQKLAMYLKMEEGRVIETRAGSSSPHGVQIQFASLTVPSMLAEETGFEPARPEGQLP